MLIWDDIRFFITVARTGTLSGAARELDVEHSTVGRRIGQLEEAINARLFHRLARGWTLTDEGAELLHKAHGVEEGITSFLRAASSIDALAGTVRISAPPLLLSHLITPNLGDLASSYPALTLELVGERRNADLLRAEADLAIRLREPTEQDLVIRRLGAVTYGLYGLEDEIQRTRPDRVFIGFDESMPDLPQKSWLESHAEGCRISIKANDMSIMLQAALAGLGIALLPEFLARPYPNLRRLELDVPIPSRSLYLVSHPDMRRAQRVQLVREKISNMLIEVLKRG